MGEVRESELKLIVRDVGEDCKAKAKVPDAHFRTRDSA